MEGGNPPPADCELADDEELKALWLACFQSIKKPAEPIETVRTPTVDASYIQTQTFPVRKNFMSKRRNGISLKSRSSNLIIITPDDSNENLPHQESAFQGTQYGAKSPQGSPRKKERSRFSRYESDSTSEESEYDYEYEENNTVKNIIASGNHNISVPKLYGHPTKSFESSEKSSETTNSCNERDDQFSVCDTISCSSNLTINTEKCASDANQVLLSDRPECHENLSGSHMENCRNTHNEFNLHETKSQKSTASLVSCLNVRCLPCSSENSLERLEDRNKRNKSYGDKNEANLLCSKSKCIEKKEKIELAAREMSMLDKFSNNESPVNAKSLICEFQTSFDVVKNFCSDDHAKNSVTHASAKPSAETDTLRSDFTEIQLGNNNNESPKDSCGISHVDSNIEEDSWEIIFDSFQSRQCNVSKGESVVFGNTSSKALESGAKEQSQSKPSVLISETKESFHHDPVMNLVMKLADELNESMAREKKEKNKNIDREKMLGDTDIRIVDKPPHTSEKSSNELIATDGKNVENVQHFSYKPSSSPDVVCLAVNSKNKSSISKPMESQTKDIRVSDTDDNQRSRFLPSSSPDVVCLAVKYKNKSSISKPMESQTKDIRVSDTDDNQRNRVLPTSSTDTSNMHVNTGKKDSSVQKKQKLQGVRVSNVEDNKRSKVFPTSYNNTFDSHMIPVESDISVKKNKNLSENDLRYALRRKIDKHASRSYADDYDQAHKKLITAKSKVGTTASSQDSLRLTRQPKSQSRSKCIQKQKDKYHESTNSYHKNDKRSRSRSSSSSSNVSESGEQKHDRKRVCSVVAYASGSFENIQSRCGAAHSSSRKQKPHKSAFPRTIHQRRTVSPNEECFTSSCQSKVPVHMRLGPPLKSLKSNASISSTDAGDASGPEDSDISSCDSSSDEAMYRSKRLTRKERSWHRKSNYRNDQ